jgi:hypothetical protein
VITFNVANTLPASRARRRRRDRFTMKKLPLLLAGLALGTSAVLSAQTTDSDSNPRRGGRGHGPGGPGGPGRGVHPIVRALDTDKNRELSAEEIASAPASLKALDRNADGAVSFEDLRPQRPADAPERSARERPAAPDGATRTRPVDPVMLALDADGDRSLSPAEMANAAVSLKALDANSDGKLTSDELRPLPPEQK